MRSQGKVRAPHQPQRWRRWEDRQSSPVSWWPLSWLEWCRVMFGFHQKTSSPWFPQTGGKFGRGRAGNNRSQIQSPSDSASPTSYESPPAWIEPAQMLPCLGRLEHYFYLSGFTGRIFQSTLPGSQTANCLQYVTLNVNCKELIKSHSVSQRTGH